MNVKKKKRTKLEAITIHVTCKECKEPNQHSSTLNENKVVPLLSFLALFFFSLLLLFFFTHHPPLS